MRGLFRLILGFLAIAGPLLLLVWLPRTFRLLGQVARLGGGVTSAMEVEADRCELYLTIAIGMLFLGGLLALVHLLILRHRDACGATWTWVLALPIACPFALPAYFALCVYGERFRTEQVFDLRPFRPWITVALGLLAIGKLLVAALSVYTIAAMSTVADPAPAKRPVEISAENLERIEWAAAWMEPTCLLLLAFPFLAWFYRAYHNLRAARLPGVSYATGWTIAGYVIPVVSIMLPFLVMQELWRGSRAITARAIIAQAQGTEPKGALEDFSGWRGAPGSIVVSCWWGAWLAQFACAAIANRAHRPGLGVVLGHRQRRPEPDREGCLRGGSSRQSLGHSVFASARCRHEPRSTAVLPPARPSPRRCHVCRPSRASVSRGSNSQAAGGSSSGCTSRRTLLRGRPAPSCWLLSVVSRVGRRFGTPSSTCSGCRCRRDGSGSSSLWLPKPGGFTRPVDWTESATS